MDVWLVELTQDTGGLESVLDAAEQKLADALRTPVLRRRFVVRRAARRHILADHLGLAPGQIRFSHGQNGKPQPVSSEGVQINCSHREDLGVVAICEDAPVGIDVEALDPGVGPQSDDLDQISQVMMSPAERAEFMALPMARRRDALLTSWTRKEAVVKAFGVGLSLPLDSFDVSVDPARPPRLLARRGPALDGQQWSMADLHLPPRYVGTVMTHGSNCRTHVRSWEPHTRRMPR